MQHADLHVEGHLLALPAHFDLTKRYDKIGFTNFTKISFRTCRTVSLSMPVATERALDDTVTITFGNCKISEISIELH